MGGQIRLKRAKVLFGDLVNDISGFIGRKYVTRLYFKLMPSPDILCFLEVSKYGLYQQGLIH